KSKDNLFEQPHPLPATSELTRGETNRSSNSRPDAEQCFSGSTTTISGYLCTILLLLPYVYTSFFFILFCHRSGPPFLVTANQHHCLCLMNHPFSLLFRVTISEYC